MKKVLFYPLVLLLFASVTAQAQVPKKTIVEHFTNTKCSVCASRNPGFYSNLNNQNDVLHLAIHPSSPYNGCLLYQQNATENDARTNFYGIYGGTPRLVINGNVISSSANYSDNALFGPYLQQTSPATLKITQTKFGTDSIRSRIVIKTVATHSLGSLTLFVVLAEDTINYTGSNGEPKHYDVFRKALSSVTGFTLNLPSTIGDSVVFSGRASTQSFWNFARINTMAILQETGNKALVQAAKFQTPSSIPTQINNSDAEGGFNIYPNPASSFVNLEFPHTTGLLEVRNSLGNLVYKQDIFNGDNAVNVSGIKPGIYFVSVLRDNRLLGIRKLIVRPH